MSHHMYLVVWSTTKPNTTDVDDFWLAFHDKDLAMAEYERLLRMPDIYSANVCVPIASTDYDTVQLPEEN